MPKVIEHLLMSKIISCPILKLSKTARKYTAVAKS